MVNGTKPPLTQAEILLQQRKKILRLDRSLVAVFPLSQSLDRCFLLLLTSSTYFSRSRVQFHSMTAGRPAPPHT